MAILTTEVGRLGGGRLEKIKIKFDRQIIHTIGTAYYFVFIA